MQRDALEQLTSVFPADNLDRANAHLEYGRSLLAGKNTVDAVMQFGVARNALANRYGDTSWRVAEIDYLKAVALDIQGLQQDAAVLRESAISRIETQLPQDHSIRQEVTSGKIL